MQSDITPKFPENPRWQCPQCGSRKVQISLPAWHYESQDYELTYIETDAEAAVMWWHCQDCGESDSGYPEEIERAPDPLDPNSNTGEYLAMFGK